MRTLIACMMLCVSKVSGLNQQIMLSEMEHGLEILDQYVGNAKIQPAKQLSMLMLFLLANLVFASNLTVAGAPLNLRKNPSPAPLC